MGTHGMKGFQHITGSHALKVITNSLVTPVVVNENTMIQTPLGIVPANKINEKELPAILLPWVDWVKAKNIEQVELFCNSLQRFLMAVSWGGHESLIMPVCSFPAKPQEYGSAYPFNMIRFYIGLEDVESLKEDLKQAFKNIE